MFAVHVEHVETLLYVAGGSVVFVEYGALGDALGRVLMRDGKLTSDQYAKALKRMSGGEPGSEPMRFGEALVALGFLNGEQVFEALAAQVRQKTIRCLTYPEPEWTFEEGRRAGGHFPCRAGRLILAAARMFEPERIRRARTANLGTRFTIQPTPWPSVPPSLLCGRSSLAHGGPSPISPATARQRGFSALSVVRFVVVRSFTLVVADI